MKNTSFIGALTALICAVMAISCAKQENAAPVKERAKVFPAEAVCHYPENVSAKKLHSLGGGTWSPVSPDEPGAGFHCVGAMNVVELFRGADASINVEYEVAGSSVGSTIITARYSASSHIENESTYRSVFANFVSDILNQALQEPMLDLTRKKILNLNSYFKAGSVQEETFYMGDGFVILSREYDETSSFLKVTLQIFPDRSLKLN